MKLILASEARDIVKRAEIFLPKPLKNLKIATIPTAKRGEVGDLSWYQVDKEKWHSFGTEICEIFLEGKDESTLRKELSGYDAIYVTGGNTHYLLEHVRKSRFDHLIKDFLKQGVIYIGTCAGSMIMGPHIYYVQKQESPTEITLTDYRGLELVNYCIVPHLNWETESPELACYHKKLFGDWRKTLYPTIALTDQQALLVEGNVTRII